MIILKQLSNTKKKSRVETTRKMSIEVGATLRGGAPTKYFLMVGSASERMKGFLSGGRWNLQKNYEHVENLLMLLCNDSSETV